MQPTTHDTETRPPTLEERTEDMLAVLDAAGSDRTYVAFSG